MKQLEMFVEPTIHDIVREYFSECDDILAHAVLVTCTDWPSFIGKDKAAMEDELRYRLSYWFYKSDGSADLALAMADGEMSQLMDLHAPYSNINTINNKWNKWDGIF